MGFSPPLGIGGAVLLGSMAHVFLCLSGSQCSALLVAVVVLRGFCCVLACVCEGADCESESIHRDCQVATRTPRKLEGFFLL